MSDPSLISGFCYSLGFHLVLIDLFPEFSMVLLGEKGGKMQSFSKSIVLQGFKTDQIQIQFGGK
jgi:hypothetical protein